MSESWIARAERALEGTASADIDVLRAGAPPVLDAAGRRAALTPLIAGFMWAAAVFRETVTSNPIDSFALLLRLLALIFTVRALLLGRDLLHRLQAYRRRAGYALVLCPQGLLLRTPEGDFVVPREDVVDIRVAELKRKGRRSWLDVYVVTRPDSGRLYLSLPPYFDRSATALAERLMRWQGVVEPRHDPAQAERAELASKLFDDVAAGARPPGTAVIEHGRGWMRGGPYASLLLGVAVLDGFVRLPAAARESISWQAPVVLALALGIVPGLWLIMTRFDIAPRKGLALILTPAELLMRTRAGVHRVTWNSVKRLSLETRTRWSLLRGQHETRALIIERKDEDKDPRITYTEAFLGAPAEVVIGLGEGYRKGLLP